MTPEEQAQKIKEIYNEAITRLKALGEEREGLLKTRKEHIQEYIKGLEAQKVSAVRQSLGLTE